MNSLSQNNQYNPTISFVDAANIIYTQSDKIDNDITKLLDQIVYETSNLIDSGFDNKDKYDILVSVDYLFMRLRILTETESIKVKKILNDQGTPASLRPFFTKRSVFLAEVSAKLTLIRDDLNVCQRMQYSSNFIK